MFQAFFCDKCEQDKEHPVAECTAHNMSNFYYYLGNTRDYITTSQKDIFSALIEDMEELESHLHLMSKEEIPQAEAKGYRQALKDTQDIIRKAREV